MTPEQFWEQDPQLYYAYEKAYKRKIENDLIIRDTLNWELGQYIAYAVGMSLSEKVKYPKKPKFHKQTVELTEEQKSRAEQVKREIEKHNSEMLKLEQTIRNKYK